MEIEIKIGNEGEWSKLEDNLEDVTIFHTWKWLKIAEKHTNSRFYPLIGMKGTTPVGIYPLFYFKVFFFNSVFSPPPWLAIPYLGPVMVDYPKLKQDKKESIFIEFQRKVDEFIKTEIKPHYTLIKLSPGILDVRPLKWNGYHVEPIYNYRIDLSKGKNYVWGQFKKNLRQNISRAIKRGISVEEGSKEELERIYESIKMRYNEQSKMTSISKEYLLDLYDAFYPEKMRIFVAKHNGEIVGGMVDLYHKKKVISWLGNVKMNVASVSPNELLQWEAIRYTIEYGMNYYEDNLNLSNKTIYVACGTAGQVAELIVWT